MIARIGELRRQGLWNATRLPMCVEPPREKTQWDYFLEEVKWMAFDFKQERYVKRMIAKKVIFLSSKEMFSFFSETILKIYIFNKKFIFWCVPVFLPTHSEKIFFLLLCRNKGHWRERCG